MTIARPVAFWRIVSPSGQTVAQLPSALVRTAPEAEQLLRDRLGFDEASGWRIAPVFAAGPRG